MRLWLSLIAYNLGNLWRRLVLPKRVGNWSLTGSAAAVGESGWQAGLERPILLDAAGGRPSDPATLRGHGAADRLAARASSVGKLPNERVSVSREGGVGQV